MDTSLHIALCDSDPGDRKQMERLLSRESDKRLPVTGGFYTDTFGGVEAILRSPMLYDVYFLDSTDPLCDSYQIAKAIRDKGILSPIVYCISSIDYRQSGPMLPNCVFMNKPIKVAIQRGCSSYGWLHSSGHGFSGFALERSVQLPGFSDNKPHDHSEHHVYRQAWADVGFDARQYKTQCKVKVFCQSKKENGEL